MMANYDDYIYRLSVSSPQSAACTLTLPYFVDLPKDLRWDNEFDWGRVSQTAEWSLTGSLFIQEGVKLKGRSIDFSSEDDQAWITRETGYKLQEMRDIPALVMKLSFLDSTNVANVLFQYNVMFRHADGALSLQHIKKFDQYEPGAYYIIKSIKLIETLSYEDQQ